ncbi:MAG TPA: DinB family protein [Anaerolineales bacterium]|nr:DinB family protein [Anaerolineales bacterium]
MITSETLNPLLLSAFTKEITWLEASTRFSLDEFIDTFYRTRERTRITLEGLTDTQVAYSSTVHPFWSISESVTHLVFTQGFYHNKLLDISTSQLAHAVEAPRGFGEGAKMNIPAADLIASLSTATKRIQVVVEGTRKNHNPEKIENSPAFGKCTYNTWMLLMLGHEVDHLRQIAAMRGLARTKE